MNNNKKEETDFGYQRVSFQEKAARVASVFHSVASRYDVMNDVMSLGVHRLWKRFAVGLMGLQSGHSVLDLAGGTGDLSALMMQKMAGEGHVHTVDINDSMLREGRDKLLNRGFVTNVHYVQSNAEALPFGDDQFDSVIIGFGLRNVAHKLQALQEMQRVVKKGGGRLVVLEFSKPTQRWLQKCYDVYSFKCLPLFGRLVANDEASYRYLAESIRLHPDQETLKQLIIEAGFDHCDYYNLSGGIVAVHRCYKF